MDTAELKALIKEEVAKALLKEAQIDLSHLHDNVSMKTLSGRPWYNLVTAMEDLINEMQDFPSLYSPRLHGPLPNTRGALVQLQMIAKMLEGVKPVVMGMDDIEKKDQ